MKVALLTGSFSRGACGVGDYAVLLADALNAISVETHLITSGDWSLLNALAFHRSLQSQGFDIVQIHYPALGFGTKLGPQGIALLRSCVVTLHEGSQSHLLRRVALLPFSVRPKHIIFFSDFERSFGLKWAPWISRISSVIPPPSNIPKWAQHGPRTLNEVVCFGLIRPGRGYDDILQLGELVKSAGLRLRIRAIGTPQSAKYLPYFEDLRARSASLPITWDHGLSDNEVAQKLASASIAYLPYPDGASELRSSLKAALLNSLAVVTTRGPHTPTNLEGVVEFCKNPDDALKVIRFLIEHPTERAILTSNAARYVKDWTWEHTAQLHAALYQKVLTTTLKWVRN
jgi:glycosyltransferase involved in cell wall biosynthesis